MDTTDITNIVNEQAVVVFSKENCVYCVLLQKDLDSMQIPYKKVMIDNNTNIKEQLIEFTKCKTVPQLFIGGKFIGGYNDFTRLCGTGRLEQLLAPFNIPVNIDF
jgi:glutaredoxin 3